jgi:hypothetical protein
VLVPVLVFVLALVRALEASAARSALALSTSPRCLHPTSAIAASTTASVGSAA